MQKPKIVDNATPSLEFQDSSTLLALDGTIVRATFQNDNFGNLFKLVEGAGYNLIDDDLEQITKATRGLYNATFTYNTSAVSTQTVDDVVLGSDDVYYEVQADAITADDPVGSVTGNWKAIVYKADKTVTHDIAADADFTLTLDQNNYGRVVITDTGILLTTPRNIIVNDSQRRTLFINNTLQDLTFKTQAGAGIILCPSSGADLLGNGTDILDNSVDMGILTFNNLMHIQDQKANGVSGGNVVIGENQRDLNAVLTNNIKGASLAVDTITLDVGKYYVEARTSYYGDNASFQISLFDNTATAMLLNGNSNYVGDISGKTNGAPLVSGIFSLSVESDIIVNMYSSVVQIGGKGIQATSGNGEVYTDAKIWKVG